MSGRHHTHAIVVSPGNTTTVPLGANGVFSGSGELVDAFNEIDVNLAGAPSAAAGAFYFEFSPNGLNWDVSIRVAGGLVGPSMPPQLLRVVLPWFRVKYVNGPTPLTELRLTTVYHCESAIRLTRYLDQPLENTEAIQVDRAIVAFRKDEQYKNVSDVDPLPITGSVGLTGATTVLQGGPAWVVSASAWIPTVTGSVELSGPVVVNQGLSAGSDSGAWPVKVTFPLPTGSNFVGYVGPTASFRDNAFASLAKLEAQAGEELRRDEPPTGDSFHGRAADGFSTGSAPWEVVRFYKDLLTGEIVRTRYRRSGSWTDRSVGWN